VFLTDTSATKRFSCQASYFSFSLAQWARAQASHLPTKKKKKRNQGLAHGKQTLRADCPKGKLEYFPSPALM